MREATASIDTETPYEAVFRCETIDVRPQSDALEHSADLKTKSQGHNLPYQPAVALPISSP
jgi:hypothetical protein